MNFTSGPVTSRRRGRFSLLALAVVPVLALPPFVAGRPRQDPAAKPARQQQQKPAPEPEIKLPPKPEGRPDGAAVPPDVEPEIKLAPKSDAAPAEPTKAAAAAPPFRFAIVGDTGTADASQYAVAKQMLAEHDRSAYGTVLMMGDNLYSNKCDKLPSVFDAPYADLLKRGVKFYATLGNHDQACAAQQLVYPGFNMGGKRAYSLAPAGDLVEFFTIDTTPLEKNSGLEQLEWLDKALAASKAEWKIAFFHHPPYSPGSRHGDDPVIIGKVLPILKKHGVRVVMTGHEHFFAKLATRDGIDFIISGSGGKIHRNAIDRQYPGFEGGDDRYHQFVSATLTRDEMRFSVIAETGAVVYTGAIARDPAAKIVPAAKAAAAAAGAK